MKLKLGVRKKQGRSAVIPLGLTLFLFILPSACSEGQMIRTGLPFTQVSDSFYERLGIDFGFSIRGSQGNPFNDRANGIFGYGPGGIQPNLTFSQGGVNSAVPPFGGYDPGTDATFGYNARNSNGGYHLGFRFGQGSNRSLVNTTPVLMTRNGVNGSLFNGTANPFVTGLIPVVGSSGAPLPPATVELTHPLEMKLRQLHLQQQAGNQTGPSGKNSDQGQPWSPPVQSAESSTATRGDLSVAEIKRLRKSRLQSEANEQSRKVDELIGKANRALANDQKGAARSYIRTAIRYASGNRKQELQQQLEELMIDK